MTKGAKRPQFSRESWGLVLSEHPFKAFLEVPSEKPLKYKSFEELTRRDSKGHKKVIRTMETQT